MRPSSLPDPVDVDHVSGLELCGDLKQVAPHVDGGDADTGASPARRPGRRHEHELGSLVREQPGAGGVPQVLADQDAGGAVGCVERAQRVAGREVTGLGEHAVVGQVELAVHVNDRLAAGVDRAVVEAVVVAFLDQSEDQIDPVGPLDQFPHRAAVDADGDLRGQVAEQVAGQRELGERPGRRRRPLGPCRSAPGAGRRWPRRHRVRGRSGQGPRERRALLKPRRNSGLNGPGPPAHPNPTS